MKHQNDEESFDTVIIGSGFGGSVSAFRLSEKGHKVAVLEAGKRWAAQDFAKTNWDIHRYLWAPIIRCFGIQRITLLKNIMVLRGVGVGGGSLVYANTLMKPKDELFADRDWPAGVDWQQELHAPYERGRRMLGVTINPMLGEADEALRALGQRLGVSHTFHPTEVGVFFGEPNKTVRDPFFGGDGPDRTGCNGCGGCMVGCRYGAKNTLDKNYLYLAEKRGAQIFAETTADRIEPLSSGGFAIHTRRTTAWLKSPGPRFRARHVIVAAGVLGSVELLLKNRDVYKTLPKISHQLGERVRTNGESLLGATSFDTSRDFSRGIAIGSAIHPDADTKIEPVRYPARSDFMRLLSVPLTDDGSWWSRPLKMLGQIAVRFHRVVRLWTVRDWARSTVILLVMQSIDRQMRLKLGRSALRGFSKGLVGGATDQPIPSFIPIAQRAAKELASELDGEPQNVISEVLLKTPATAHILGGCCMATDESKGVVDIHHQVFNYPGLYVCDGSVIPVNLGVNPSLTITALAERFTERFKI